MKKTIGIVLATAFLLVAVGCDDNDGEEACTSYAQKCPAGSAGAVACSADRINDASNGGDVEDCVQASADCAAATACLATLK